METNKSVLERELQNKLLSLKDLNETEWKKLEYSVNQLQDNFVSSLREKFSGLSKDDIHIILLMRINIKNIEIARLLHILPKSFRMRRCRLKKKMRIDCDSLSEFIKNLFR